MKASHTVTAEPGEDIFSILRRWKATKPAGASNCIFIELDHSRRARLSRARLAA